MKRLYRSNSDKVFAGVLGGLGDYLDMDPTVLRLAYILISIVTGIFPAVVGYIIAYLLVPKKPVHVETHSQPKEAEFTETRKDEV